MIWLETLGFSRKVSSSFVVVINPILATHHIYSSAWGVRERLEADGLLYSDKFATSSVTQVFGIHGEDLMIRTRPP